MAAASRGVAVRAGGGSLAGKVLYRLGWTVAWLLVRAVARPRREASAVPRHGALLLVANHTSWFDPMLLATTCPRPVAFLAKEQLFHPAPWGRAMRAAGIIPVRRGTADRQALDAALGVLEAGGALAIFAEGTRSPDGVLLAAEAGVGLLAARSGAPALPVALIGTERLRTLADCLRRPRLRARYGSAWTPLAPARGGGAAYRQLAQELMAHVAALLPAERRGPFTEGAADALGATAGGRGAGEVGGTWRSQ